MFINKIDAFISAFKHKNTSIRLYSQHIFNLSNILLKETIYVFSSPPPYLKSTIINPLNLLTTAREISSFSYLNIQGAPGNSE